MQKRSQHVKINRVVLTNIFMVLVVVAVVAALVLMTMGFSLTRDGNVAQTGLVQFGATPTGSTVKIDGVTQFSRTNSNARLNSGSYNFEITHNDYDSWHKTANVESGRVLWLNYARLLPKTRNITTVRQYESLFRMSVSPSSRYVFFLWPAPTANAEIVDTSGNDVRVQNLAISQLFANLAEPDVQHDFRVAGWSEDETKLLIAHTFGDQVEWVWVNTRTPAASLNLTTEYRLGFSSVQFASRSGNLLWLVENGNLRRADVGSRTVTSALVNHVTQVSRVSENAVLLITENITPEVHNLSFGYFRNGDGGPSEIYSTAASDQPVSIIGGEYFNEDYVIIREGNRLQILCGSFPVFGGRANTTLQYVLDKQLDWTIERLELNPSRRFVHALNKGNVFNYDLENRLESSFALDGTYDTAPALNWLDGYIIWTDYDGQLTIYDFDGDNKRDVAKLESGFRVALSNSGRWLYFVGSDGAGGYRLQRLRMLVN